MANTKWNPTGSENTHVKKSGNGHIIIHGLFYEKQTVQGDSHEPVSILFKLLYRRHRENSS